MNAPPSSKLQALARQAALDYALLDAARAQDNQWMEILLDRGANPNASDYARWSDIPSPLHHVARWDNEEGAKLLLQAGAHSHVLSLAGHTALQEAVKLGNLNIVEALLGYGVDPDCLDGFGKTAHEKLQGSTPNDLLINQLLKSHSQAKALSKTPSSPSSSPRPRI